MVVLTVFKMTLKELEPATREASKGSTAFVSVEVMRAPSAGEMILKPGLACAWPVAGTSTTSMLRTRVANIARRLCIGGLPPVKRWDIWQITAVRGACL